MAIAHLALKPSSASAPTITSHGLAPHCSREPEPLITTVRCTNTRLQSMHLRTQQWTHPPYPAQQVGHRPDLHPLTIHFSRCSQSHLYCIHASNRATFSLLRYRKSH